LNIFDYQKYQDFLRELTQGAGSTRGLQAKLAQAAGCQASYLSQALKGKVHLTEDQVMGIAEFMDFSSNQTDYLLLLLRLEKAATERLKTYLLKRVQDMRSDQLSLKHQVGPTSLHFNQEDLAVYAQSWIYSAAHILCSSPNMTTEKIAGRLSISQTVATRTLKDLNQMGFVTKAGNFWKYGGSALHVPRESPWNKSLQQSRRELVQRSISMDENDATHFSTVFTIDEFDLAKLRAAVGSFVKKSHDTIHRSGTEVLGCLVVDLFKIV
jgi:uncharacterized protein (TIGR02147 family)